MKKLALFLGVVLPLLTSVPADAASLSKKEEARVARAEPEDQDMVRECLLKKKKGKKTGAIAGAAAGAGVGLIAGGNLGESALAAGAAALAGHEIGKGTSTNKSCDEVLKRNK